MELNDEVIDRVIEMAWEDRTPFEHIFIQFNLSESDVIKIMRLHLSNRSFKNWRARVTSRKTKHLKKIDVTIERFRCKTQNKYRQS